jgi:hypothetical protein
MHTIPQELRSVFLHLEKILVAMSCDFFDVFAVMQPTANE